MKRIIKITIIVLLTIIFLAHGSYAIGYADWNNYYKSKVGNDYSKVIGQNGIVYDLDNWSYVTLNQYLNVGYSTGSGYISALNQPNILCIQHGVDLNSMTMYRVNSEVTVTDPVLAYILYNAVEENQHNLQTNWESEWQKRLWIYLKKNESKLTSILGGKQILDYGEGKRDNATPEEIARLNNLNNNIPDNSKANVSVEVNPYNSSQVIISVEGCENYRLYYKNKSGTETEIQKNSTHKYSVPKTSLPDNGTTVRIVYNTYNVKYRVLESEHAQRLLVVTHTGIENKTDSASIKFDIDRSISLEKFVTAVNDKVFYDTRYDFNGDGILNVGINNIVDDIEDETGKPIENFDVYLLLMYDVGLDMPEEYKEKIRKYGDFDGNGTINSADSRIFRRMIDYGRETLRDGYRHNYNLSDGNNNKNPYKKNNPVVVKNGDIVTFRIILTNTSTKNYIYVKQITDKYLYSTDGPKLIYKSATANNEDYILTVTDNAKGELTINIKSPTSNYVRLIANASEYIDLKFQVSIPDTYAGNVNVLENKAYVTTIYNENGNSVTDADGSDNNYDMDFLKVEAQRDVSLQKYITKVNDTSVSPNRANMKTRKSETDSGANKNITKALAQKNEYKKDSAVKIEVGDLVTYRVSVYNNSNYVVKNVKVVDILPYYTHNNEIKCAIDLSSISIKQNGSTDVTSNWGVNAAGSITTTINQIPKNGEVYFDITFKFNVFVTGLLQNTAYITNESASKTYRTLDRDYVQMKEYKVSLEKYVSAVNEQTITGREGKRLNENQPVGEYRDPYKSTTLQGVDVGDIVTYTIKLTNNGDAPVIITQIYDTFRVTETGTNKGAKLEYNSTNNKVEVKNSSGNTYYDGEITNKNGKEPEYKNDGRLNNDIDNGNKYLDVYIISFDNAKEISPNESVYINLKFKVIVPTELTNISQNFYNKAGIIQIKNRNNIEVLDSDGTGNWHDMDWVKTKTYAVSLQKIINKVNGIDVSNVNTTAVKTRWNSWENKANENTAKTGNQYYKYWNPVEVENDDTIQYAIKVTNNSDATIKEFTIKDTMPAEGLRYTGYEDSSDIKSVSVSGNIISININKTLVKNESITVYLNAQVTEPSISLDVKRNYAEIIEGTLKNRNDVLIKDTTPNDNQDADYFQMKDITISGMVWNDVATDKETKQYNGTYDEGELIFRQASVELYRGDNKVVETRTTTGSYTFSASENYSGQTTGPIKGPRVTNGTRWSGTYYSYYIVFGYDGVKYTPTTFADLTSNNPLDSNAKEDNGKISISRNDFNNKFATIKNDGAYNSSGNKTTEISYSTINEEGYIPEYRYEYNSYMSMKASTNVINIENVTEDQLQHVNLGLRGRDIFDLELTSDVYSTKVTVNGIDGGYTYNSNKVTLRRNDISDRYSHSEDMANLYMQESEYANESYDQAIRDTDISTSVGADKRIENYSSTGLGIEVTYKITVKNASNTAGTATKITNYYDSKYTIDTNQTVKGYYYDSENKQHGISGITLTSGTESGANYGSVIVTVPETMLEQSEKIEIYLVYTLNDPSTTLDALVKGTERIPTFNMAEITEYKTALGEGQTEYTRGLIDKDSQPGSANTETVRLHPNTLGNVSTVQYYFGENDLSVLKYEDDTYATPTLYFVISDDTYTRTITGTVFEDLTTINSNRVKSGNGIKDGNDPTIKGITVELVEGDKVRYRTTTDDNGIYTFTNFLPGNYIIRYYYGDREDTFLKKDPNKKSYNGEDFQATNNRFEVDEIEVHKLSTTPDYWYLENEADGISIATDSNTRRSTVSENVVKFSVNEMTKLNDAREGEQLTGIGDKNDPNSLIGRTYMYSNTPSMRLNVEKTDNPEQDTQISSYEVSNMNFGIAEVPVTVVDLQKEVQSFTIKDATGQNVLASASKNSEGRWEQSSKIGDVTTEDGMDKISVQIEDIKLQGAKLQITYNIISEIAVEKNFDNTSQTVATIKGLVDYIDNNLSYNGNLGDNNRYWEITTYDAIKEELRKTEYGEETIAEGMLDSNGNRYTTVVKATADNPILNTTEKATATITLEKVLSSTDSTIDEIITSTVEPFVYNNIVEITLLDYGNTEDSENIQRDRIREPNRYIIIPGVQYGTASGEEISISPPTGDSSISTVYYVIAAISLTILAAGVFGIKKFVVKK